MNLKVTSNAFKDGDMIPSLYTCDGKDISPAITFSGAPKETVSFALVADDPDAPMGTWVHWVVYNIPSDVNSLPENYPPDETMPDGTRQGITDFGGTGYGGPCPPSGTHRYFFKVYALDKKINLVAIADKAALEQAMEGHILAKGQLMGKYKRK